MTNINIENIMNTCNDSKNFTNIPTSWLKCGEVFYNSMEKPIFVCSICLRNADGINTTYTTHDGSVFWCHIQQQHISQECETIDKISAEIESFDTNDVETEMSIESIYLDFGGDKVKQDQIMEKFHDKLIKSVATTTNPTEENKDILQNLDIKVEHEEIHESILLPDDKKVDTTISNFSECNYYYDENETYLISDDEDEFNEGAEDQEYPIIIGNYVRDYLRHNDMVVISDDDEDNVTTRPSSPISIDENTKINQDCQKTRVKNDKYTDFKKIGENFLPQTNIPMGILTPDVSPSESLTSQQYDKTYTVFDGDVQESRSHTMDASPCESPTAQQHNKDAPEKQVCTPDVSPCESLTIQQHNNIYFKYNEGIQEKRVPSPYVSHTELLKAQQYNSKYSVQNESAQKQRVPTPGISSNESLTSMQKDNTHSRYNKDAQATPMDTLNMSPCGSLKAQQYNNAYCAQNESAREQRIPTHNVSSSETITAMHYGKNYAAYIKYIQEQGVSSCGSLTTQKHNSNNSEQNESAQEHRAPTPAASLCESLTSQQKENTHAACNKEVQDSLTSQQKDNSHSAHNKEAQEKRIDTLDVAAYESLIAQHSNRYSTQNKSDQERRVPTPNVLSCNSLPPQHYNIRHTAYADNVEEQRGSPCVSRTTQQYNTHNENAQEHRAPTPGASLYEGLMSQQKDNIHAAYNKEAQYSLTSQQKYNTYSAYNKEAQEKLIDTLNVPAYGSLTAQHYNRYFTQNKSDQERQFPTPNVLSCNSLTPQHYNIRHTAYTANVEEPRVSPCGSRTTQQYNAQKENAQEHRVPTPGASLYDGLMFQQKDNTHSVYNKEAQEKGIDTPDVPAYGSLTAQHYNNRYCTQNKSDKERRFPTPNVSSCNSLTPQHYNIRHPAYAENVQEQRVSPFVSRTTQQYNSQNESTQEQRVPTPGASFCESLTSQQKDSTHYGYNKDTQEKRIDTRDMFPYGPLMAQEYNKRYCTQNERAQEQRVATQNVLSCESLTTQYYNKCYIAHTENIKEQLMNEQKIPTLITQHCSNNYSAQNTGAQEKRAFGPHVSPYESLIREHFNNRYAAACTENVQEQRVHTPHMLPCLSRAAQQDNNRYSAYKGNAQEHTFHRPNVSSGKYLIPQHCNNTFTAFSENPVHTHHVPPPSASLPAQEYNSHLAYNENCREKKKRSARLREFQCTVCCRRMISEEKMEIHMKKFHKSALPQLEINQNIQSHHHQMHPSFLINKNHDSSESNGSQRPPLINCKSCKTKTKTLKAMERHQKLYHSSETPFLVPQCPICKVRVLRKNLQHHIELHFAVGLTCPYCGIVCKQKYGFDKHIRLCHKDKNTNSVSANLQQVTRAKLATMSHEKHQYRNHENEQTFNNVISPQNPQS